MAHATTPNWKEPKVDHSCKASFGVLRVQLVLAAALALVSLPAVGSDGPQPEDLLGATLLDPLVPGETARLAVSWKGLEEAFLTVELSGGVVATSQIEPGVRVLEVEVPWRVESSDLKLHAVGWDGEAFATALQGGCAWSPGDPANGVDGDVQSLTVYDDGGGEALYLGGGFGRPKTPSTPAGASRATRPRSPSFAPTSPPPASWSASCASARATPREPAAPSKRLPRCSGRSTG